MGPQASSLPVLVLCLAQTIHMQEGVLPKPSIRGEPGPVICQGHPVTIVCWSPAEAEIIRLESENRSVYGDRSMMPLRGSNWTEARFQIPAVSDDTDRRYQCRYRQGTLWSESSEVLELKVADPTCQNYTVGNYVRLGLSGVVLLILVAILAEAGHSWHRWPHPPQEWRQESEHQRN